MYDGGRPVKKTFVENVYMPQSESTNRYKNRQESVQQIE